MEIDIRLSPAGSGTYFCDQATAPTSGAEPASTHATWTSSGMSVPAGVYSVRASWTGYQWTIHYHWTLLINGGGFPGITWHLHNEYHYGGGSAMYLRCTTAPQNHTKPSSAHQLPTSPAHAPLV